MIESERRGFSPTDIISYVFCCSNMGVPRVMKEIKLSCCKCHFEFLTTVANMKQDTHPSLLISLPSLSHPQWHLDLTNGTRLYSPFAHLPQYTLFAPQTSGIRIVFNFSWGDYNTQKKLSKILGYKQGVLQEMCKWRMLFSKSGDFIYVFTK